MLPLLREVSQLDRLRAFAGCIIKDVMVQRMAGRKRFLEFFIATIRNENTRMAYARAVGSFFGIGGASSGV